MTDPASIPRPLPPEEEGEKIRKRPLPRNTRFFSREMRKNPTKAEAKLWKELRFDKLGVRFRRQYVIGGRILDFYCPKFRLGIELDGEIHTRLSVRREDELRDEYLKKEHDIRLLRFRNDEVFVNLQGVLQRIQTAVLQSSKTIPPLLRRGG